MNISFHSRLAFVCAVFIFIFLCYFMKFMCRKQQGDYTYDWILQETKENIQALKSRIAHLHLKHGRNVNIKQNKQPLILITPTYKRYTQQADLVRLYQTLKHVQNLHWILIEDSETKTDLVSYILKTSGLKYTHLNIATRRDLVRGKNDPRWKKHRGVDQRNHALRWIRENWIGQKGVVYFADDDNTYHLKLFEEMRKTKKVSIWPVALVGGLLWEGPVCKGGRVERFHTGWKPERSFPVDMASFSFNVELIIKYPMAYINPDVERGYLETNFLEQLKISRNDLEARADDCSKILVWHTQTSEPKMKQEDRLQNVGKGSNPKIIV